MDSRFYVVREERRREIVKRHVAPQPEDPVRVLVMEPSAEHFHINMAGRYHDHDTSYGGGFPTMNVMKTGHGKQLPVPEATHNVSIHSYRRRPPVATKVLQYQQPIAQNQQASLLYHYDQEASQANPHPVKNPAPGTVIDCYEAARIYGGVVIRDPPQVKKPAPEKVIDCYEAARIYGGVVIKDFGRNNKPPGRYF